MKFLSLSPNVMVYNIEESITWYRQNLGFELIMTAPETKPFDWAMLQRDEITLMLQTKKSIAAELEDFKDMVPGGSMSFFTKVEGIDKIYTSISDRSCIVAEPNTTFYGMREFIIKDLNGYYFTFAEEAAK